MPRLPGFLGRVAHGRSGRVAAATVPLSEPTPVGSIQRLLSSHLARGRAAWPKLAMDPARFTDRLRTLAGGASDHVAYLEKLNSEDLYLACACLDGVPGAVEQFQRRLRSAVATALRGMGGSSDLQEETTQRLLARFLVGTKERGPALAEYEGRSKLAVFLGVAAQRLALDNRRDSRTRHRLLDRLAQEMDQHQTGAEQILARGKFRKPFEQALRASIDRLSQRDRVILRLHLIGRLSTRRLAIMYKVNQATASRWLANAREAVWSDVRRELGAKLRLDPADLDSVMRTIQGDRDVSVSSLLTESLAEGRG